MSWLHRAFHFAGVVETAAKQVKYYHEVGYDRPLYLGAVLQHMDVYIVMATEIMTYCHSYQLCCCVCKRTAQEGVI